MKLRIIPYLLSLIFVPFAFAEFQFKVTQEFKKGEGEITVIGKSFDDVSVGIARTLVRLKCKIVEKDKDLGLMVAEREDTKDVYADGKVVSTEKYVADRWEILIEILDDEVIVSCLYEGDGKGFWGSRKKMFEEFCSRLEKFLGRSKGK